jgi:hypothetical protein
LATNRKDSLLDKTTCRAASDLLFLRKRWLVHLNTSRTECEKQWAKISTNKTYAKYPQLCARCTGLASGLSAGVETPPCELRALSSSSKYWCESYVNVRTREDSSEAVRLSVWPPTHRRTCGTADYKSSTPARTRRPRSATARSPFYIEHAPGTAAEHPAAVAQGQLRYTDCLSLLGPGSAERRRATSVGKAPPLGKLQLRAIVAAAEEKRRRAREGLNLPSRGPLPPLQPGAIAIITLYPFAPQIAIPPHWLIGKETVIGGLHWRGATWSVRGRGTL